jgi:cytochrome P450 family 9
MRATLSPAFTGSKMRQMFELMNKVGQQSAETLKHQIEQGKAESEVDFQTLARKFTVDSIATCAFGIEVNSFENPENDFHHIATKTTNFTTFSTALKFLANMAFPRLMKVLKIKLISKEVDDFFRYAIHDTMKIREEKGIIRHDMINILMQVKKGQLTHEKENEEKVVDGFATVEESQVGKSSVNTKWDDEDLSAQCFIFFLAG